MDWHKIRQGEYRSDEGHEIAALPATDENGDELSTYEWFVYDPQGNMLDGYTTMCEAKASVE